MFIIYNDKATLYRIIIQYISIIQKIILNIFIVSIF